jgi:hypothetical protein
LSTFTAILTPSAGINSFFMQAYVPEIIAHEKGRELTITVGPGRNRTGGMPNWLAAPDLAMGNERYINTPATTTIPASVMTIYYGFLKIELHAVDPAHTTGDVIVSLPQEKVVFGGDICIFDAGPLGGSSGLGTIRALEWILSVESGRVVPAHGPVDTNKDVLKGLEYFTIIRDGMTARIAAGLSPVPPRQRSTWKISWNGPTRTGTSETLCACIRASLADRSIRQQLRRRKPNIKR